MPQIAILPVAPAQAPEVNTPSSTSSEDFAPHLTQAVNKQNKPQDTKSTSETNNDASAKTDNADTDQIRDVANQSSDEDSQHTVKSDQDKGSAQDDGTDIQQLQTASQEKPQTTSENSTKAENNFFSSLASKLLAAEMDSDNLDPELTEFIKSAVSNTSKGQVMSAVTSAAANNEEKSALLAQLQQIIENSSETGIVSIKRGNGINAANASPLLSASTTAQQQQVSTNTSSTLTEHLLAVNVDGMQKAGDATAEQINAQRQSTQQQYLDAKLSLQTSSDSADDTTEQNSSSSDQSSTSQSGQQVTTTAFSSTDNTGIFSVASTSTAQTTATTPLPTTDGTITLPSGTMVHENEVLQQIAERFQVGQRMTDTHINIKLHPAELGELKIDLTVKEGSIRAHVIAQSQQVQEIIERNMAKLKVSLEDQGFTLDEITVATQSDSVGQFDLFDGELAQQNEYAQGNSSRSQKISAALYQNEEFPDLPIENNQTGVNLTI